MMRGPLLRDMAKYDAGLDHFFIALGDPTRRAIVERLTRGPATASELASPHDMALPSFMAHLKRLEASGLVLTEKQGRSRMCRLAPGAFAPARSWLEQQEVAWSARLDQFDAYVTRLAKERDT